MIQQHHYCDGCGKQVSYVDSDGEVCVQSVVANNMLVDVTIRTTSGQSSSRTVFNGGEFCGFDCFNKRLAPIAYFISAKDDLFLKD